MWAALFSLCGLHSGVLVVASAFVAMAWLCAGGSTAGKEPQRLLFPAVADPPVFPDMAQIDNKAFLWQIEVRDRAHRSHGCMVP